MTLVLSCMTHDYVVQVCDRRLTNLDGILYDDDANKAVLFSNRFSLSYTGLGFIGLEPTNLWLTRVLTGVKNDSVPEALQAIQEEATKDFKKIGWSGPHAFVGAGWSNFDSPNQLRPVICTVSNFHEKDGQILSKVSDQFAISASYLGQSSTVVISVVGQPLSTGREPKLRRSLERSASRGGKARAAVRLLVNEVRTVAATNDTVGSGLMAVAIPKGAVENNPGQKLVFGGSPVKGATTFEYYPPDDNFAVAYGPNIVFPGVMTTISLTVERSPSSS